MKKLLFTALLGVAFLLPANYTATVNTTASKTELSSKKQKKKAKKSKSNIKSSESSNYKKSNFYSQSKGCMYNGNKLYVGERGGCYYYSGKSKQYVDRSYCSNCN
ncbi:hypothetical protein CLU96_0850 [Chryseobacterium sp. 52]|uniref:hypothetical protein n=1 Tax=Chryseobacterium sp. 52 TaxID=2035213 RepID=UPI000C190B91|nr:hypothetical protein [Chryseobacterium sp. 52]PIF43926.1 hypothetical protein CLU96_0850 [Chryseobacterium sp. 52]